MEPQVRKALLVQPALQVQMDWMALLVHKVLPGQRVQVAELPAQLVIPAQPAQPAQMVLTVQQDRKALPALTV